VARSVLELCPLSNGGSSEDITCFAKRTLGFRVLRNVLALLLSLLVLNLIRASAQDLGGFEQGIKPYGAYHGGNIDSISMVNGKLTLHISLISYPQRGSKLHSGFSVAYYNPLYQLTDNCLNGPPRCIPNT
jgi:hypothetical protein